MKKIVLVMSLALAMANLQAQNYQISFAGTGTATTVDSVKVENLTQNTLSALGGSDTLNLIVTLEINELNNGADNTMHIYPNPMTGACTIDFEATAQGTTTIGLYDINGKRIKQVQVLLLKGHHVYSLSGICSGVYFLKIESDKYSYTSKIVSINATSGTTEIKHIETTPGINKKSLVLNTGEKKGVKSVINMQYTTGDILKLTGKSGNYRTISMLVPTQGTTITFNFVVCTDVDSNHYAVVQIGTQTWMAENLKTTKYNDNTAVPLITDNVTWGSLTTPGYCWYNNDPTTNKNTYGGLYNWHSVNTGKLAPTGWHVPTDAEWTTLATYLGAVIVVGGYLKETGLTHWQSPNTGATNEIGFTALPGGYRITDGTFIYIGYDGSWWSSTENIPTSAWNRSILYNSSSLDQAFSNKVIGFSVRCVKD